MRKLRSRIAIFLAVLVVLSCVSTLILTYRFQNAARFDREQIRLLFLGTAVRDVLLVVVALALLIVAMILITRGTTDPIRTLANAANEIARGNYDVQVHIRQDRVEEYGELQRSFNAMAQELKGNEYLRKDFISSVSHELKTPLAIIEGYADLLNEGELSPSQQREYAAAIAAESARLSRMTENMLRLSRMDQGRQQIETTRYRLDEQIRRCLIRLEAQWSAKNLEPEIELDALYVSGDEALLEQVWFNLLENAIKFSNEGGMLGVKAYEKDGNAIVCVQDQGVGMDEQTRAHMFERFYQGDASHNRSGSGLGLSIVRRIVQLHDGAIDVKSAPNRGTSITVTLKTNP